MLGTNKFLISPDSRIWFYLKALGVVYLYFRSCWASQEITGKNADLGKLFAAWKDNCILDRNLAQAAKSSLLN